MSHRHWCESSGRYWQCPGAAVRLFQAEPTICMCIQHGIPMEEGDHSECAIELLSCPEHRADQMRAMGYEPHCVGTSSSRGSERSPPFMDADGNRTVGFCLWCGRDFYTIDEHDAHTAANMAACSAFQEFKDQNCMPPVLQAMFEDAGLIDHDDGDDE